MPKELPALFGPYVFLKSLGRGAMGDVHLARPLDESRNIPVPVVVKRLHGELADRKGFIARFRHEAVVAVSVNNPHVAKVYDIGAVGDTLYIAMEYIPGWPLSGVLDEILKSGRHASIASIVDLVAGGLEGLNAVHTARDPKTNKPMGIVHRDISPKNLMVSEQGKMHLIDLGLGKSNIQNWKTRTGVVMGSVGYMPPEQARGERVDARADVYAMGVVTFEMFALRNYVPRGSLSEMMESSMRPKFRRPSTHRPDLPPGLDGVIEQAMQPDAADRFQSAKEFLAALRDIVPATHTQGEMASLLDELFGAGRADREQEMKDLLALPDPDEMEEEDTKIFVSAKGVAPPDQQPTKYAAAKGVEDRDSPDIPSTRATEVAGWSEKSKADQDTSPSTSASESASGRVSPFYSDQIVSQRSISLGQLIAAVAVTALLAGVIAAAVTLLVVGGKPTEEIPVVTMPPKAQPIPEPSPSVSAQPLPTEEKKVKRKSRPTQVKRVKRTVEVKRSPEPSKPVDEDVQLNRRFDRLKLRVDRLRKKSSNSPELKKALRKFLHRLSMERLVTDEKRRAASILELEARLEELEKQHS